VVFDSLGSPARAVNSQKPGKTPIGIVLMKPR
jgi:hypothetical protein